MKNRLDDLRDHLFMALERLNDEQKPVEVDREKQICNVASVLVESAKAEALMMEALGQSKTTSVMWREKALEAPKQPNQLGYGLNGEPQGDR